MARRASTSPTCSTSAASASRTPMARAPPTFCISAATARSIYLNLSGNALSTARRVPECPAIDSVATIDVADLLGRGTACLIWSSPLPDEAGRQLRYIDLMCGRKPHLLARIDNNMGSETRIDYVSSTECYLADKLAGTPWVTRLPFPVHVVRGGS